MLKKITVLAMAVGVLAALALPTAASASWKHHQTPIQQNVTLDLTGFALFEGALGSVKCQITSQATFLAGQTTGIAHTFDAHPGDETQNCDAGGALNPCQIHNLTPQQNVNWTFHTGAFQTVTNIHNGTQTTFGSQFQKAAIVTADTIESQSTGGVFCMVQRIVIHPETIGLIEHGGGQDGDTISELEINGTAKVTVQTNGAQGATHTEHALVTGTLQIEKENLRNTYSL